MTDFKRVTDEMFVAPQISADDIERAAKDGFQAIIVNRPDGEMLGQPKMADLKDHAEKLGLTFAAVPIAGPPTPNDVSAMSTALEAANGKVLAYCRSGTRSVTLWALAMAGKGDMTSVEIVRAAADAGYDLSGYAATFDALRPEK